MNEANYQDLLDFQRFDNLVNNELYVSVEDYKFIVAYDFSEKENDFCDQAHNLQTSTKNADYHDNPI